MSFNTEFNNENEPDNSGENENPQGGTVKEVAAEKTENKTGEIEKVSASDTSETAIKTAFSETAEVETTASSPVKKPEEAEIVAEEKTETEPVEEKPQLPSRLVQMLSAEVLPEIPSKDTVRLQIQSPNRIWLYWRFGKNPYVALQKAFGSRANAYSITLRLTNTETGEVKFFPASVSGSYWFNEVKSGTRYKVDVGFSAPNRPFIRLLSSNEVETPRPAPSPRIATDADFAVRVPQFVEILEASGYSHQTAPLRFAAENKQEADAKTLVIVQRLSKKELPSLEGVNLLELRWALLSLLAGVALDDVKKSVSPELGAWLSEVEAQNATALKPENVKAIMQSILGEEFVQAVVSGDIETRKKYVSKVFGASAVEVYETIVPNAIDFPTERLTEKLFPSEFSEETAFDAPTSR